ncbi:hypothetical protein ABT301_16900 [Streptomyces sp. NPDC000987]|uniref:restriction system modified-DNA reader domain-containing protein n=1 Tax=Streptomyces sp. NPDC000987 TaxID=3154374 RepID=UPI0033240BC2
MQDLGALAPRSAPTRVPTCLRLGAVPVRRSSASQPTWCPAVCRDPRADDHGNGPRPRMTPGSEDPPSPKSRASGQPPLTRSRKTAASEDERQVGFEEMMAAGRVTPGATLHGDYMGQRHTATVLTTGQIRYQEKVYPSLSAAGQAVKLHVRGRDTPESTLSTDGWEFWRTADPVCGDEVSLKTLRRRVVRTQRDQRKSCP